MNEEELLKEGFEEVNAPDIEMHDFIKNNSVVGQLISVETNVGANGSNVYTLKNKEGELIKFWGSTVIDRNMQVINPDDWIAVVYLGMAEGKNGRKYKNYKILRRPAPDTQGNQEIIDQIPF